MHKFILAATIAAGLGASGCGDKVSSGQIYSVQVMSGGQVVRIFDKAKISSFGNGVWKVTDQDGEHFVTGEIVATPIK